MPLGQPFCSCGLVSKTCVHRWLVFVLVVIVFVASAQAQILCLLADFGRGKLLCLYEHPQRPIFVKGQLDKCGRTGPPEVFEVPDRGGAWRFQIGFQIMFLCVWAPFWSSLFICKILHVLKFTAASRVFT